MTAALPAASRCDSDACSAVAAVTAPEGQPAEQSVEPHAHAAAREAHAPEQDDAGVEAEVGAEPQRVAERGHGRPAVVGDEVDQPAAAVQQDAGAQAQPDGALGLHPGGAGQAQGARAQVDDAEEQLPGQAVGPETQRGVRDARDERADAERRRRHERTTAPARHRLHGSVRGHERVVGAPVRQVEYG